MRPRAPLLALAVAGLAAAPASAQETATTAAGNFAFTPADVTVNVGETVRFTNAGGFHNVRFDGEAALVAPGLPESPGWQAGVTRTFTAPGTFRFVCVPHEIAFGMVGSVTVRAANVAPAPTPTPAPAPSPSTPAPSPSTPAAPAPTATVRTLELVRERACTRRGATCRRPGIVLRVDLTAAGVLAGTLERRAGRGYRAFGSLGFGRVAAGGRTVRFSRTSAGRRLTPGRYRVRMTLDGRAARTLRFAVRDS